MRLGKASRFGMSFGTASALTVLSLVFAACSSSSTSPPNDNPDSGDAAAAPLCGLPNQAGTSPPPPGAFPAPDCSTLSPGSSCTQQNLCPVTDAKCGPNTACLAFADNSKGSTLDFRIRRLTVVAPPKLAQTFIQGGVVTPAIELPYKECGESGTPQKGGLFNWLIRVDKATNTLTTGGAPPSTDPFGTGYCFMNNTISGHNIAPIGGQLTFQGNTFTSSPATNTLYVPIFVSPPKVPLDPTQVVLLPIQQASLNTVTVSPDGNCIGSYNPEGPADSTCLDDPTSCSKWNTAGSIAGFITMTDADGVIVASVSQSLCAVLTGKPVPDPSGSGISYCPKDGSVKGDYCSTTKSPGGCQDSFWLSSTFAASAIKINDGAADPLCAGGSPADGGSDSGASDASGG